MTPRVPETEHVPATRQAPQALATQQDPATQRILERIITSVPTSDGAGVRLRRSLGRSPSHRVDPFLMLDQFSSENPADYVAGFPSHPHRGFETVTYLVDGHMLHEDHLGHRSAIENGGVQWMTAGRGIIHSEMPQQEQGRMRGFQLWVNLPAAEKMKPAAYRNVQPSEIPVVDLAGGVRAKVIAGTLRVGKRAIAGPIQGGTVAPFYADVELPPGASASIPVESSHAFVVMPFEGEVTIGGEHVPTHAAGVLGPGNQIEFVAGSAGARVLVFGGRPIGEPVVQHGPFVMNTVAEIAQAMRDYDRGTLATPR